MLTWGGIDESDDPVGEHMRRHAWQRAGDGGKIAGGPGGACGAGRNDVGSAGDALAGSLDGSREFATANLLLNGDVLVLGGYDGQIRTSATAWLVPQGAWSP